MLFRSVVAAGCILPLTQDDMLSSDLGTRHRAAIGMSELSDAVCLVVSEETGTISSAQNGEMTRALDSVSLRTLLREALLDNNDSDKKLFGRWSAPWASIKGRKGKK